MRMYEMKKKAMAESVLPSLWLRNIVREIELAQESPDKTWNLKCHVLRCHSIICNICTHTDIDPHTDTQTHRHRHRHTRRTW